MPRGGHRPGAGRKKGDVPKKIKAVVPTLELKGKMPLEVILHAMNAYLEENDLKEALKCANMAAPYCHPRLSTTTVHAEGTFDLEVVTGLDAKPKETN